MVTGWPLRSGCSKLSRTVESCWLREAGRCLPWESSTRETLSAWFRSNAAEVTLSSSGVNRTTAFTAMDCVLGEISASMVYCSTSMRERRSCASAATARRPAAMAAAIEIRELRNMCDLSFQDFLNNGGRAPRRGHSRLRQFFPDLCEAGLHLSARVRGGQQPARLARNRLPAHPALHQLGDHRAPGNQVHHRIKRHPHQQLSRQPTRRRHLVKGHHGGSQ